MVLTKPRNKFYILHESWLLDRVKRRCRKAFPTTAELRKEIGDTVLTEYAAALDDLVAKRESTMDRLREAARAAKERPAPAVTKEKAAHRSAGPEL